MILVDSSVWIGFFRAEETAQVARLKTAIERNEDLCVCGIVLMEILQGIRATRRRNSVSRMLDDLIYLPMRRSTFRLAADLFRAAQSRGRTTRKSADCMIAAVAVEHDVPLLQADRDFVSLAECSKLQLLDPAVT